jgi:hypothetical protein
MDALILIVGAILVAVLAFLGVKTQPVPTPEPEPEPAPIPVPEPTPGPLPEPEPVPDPLPTPEPPPEPIPDPPPLAPILTIAEQVEFLTAIGLPSGSDVARRQSWVKWQTASTWHDLAPDGVCGELTTEDARTAAANGHGFSPHFHPSEFTCKCGGTNPGCEGWLCDRELVLALERARAKQDRPLKIVCGYRDPIENARVLGKPYSQHLFGRAVDVPNEHDVSWWKGLGLGLIGKSKHNNNAVHVDVTPGKSDGVFNE